MDGIVPYIYIFIFVGVVISFLIFIGLSVYAFKRRSVGNVSGFALFVGKTNFIFGILLLFVTFISRNTIIGYGPLVYIVPSLFFLVMFSFYFLKKIK